jgi:hypothetical protein
VVVQVVSWWTSGFGHHHGGAYATLTATDARTLADVLNEWAQKPYSTEGPIYSKSID